MIKLLMGKGIPVDEVDPLELALFGNNQLSQKMLVAQKGGPCTDHIMFSVLCNEVFLKLLSNLAYLAVFRIKKTICNCRDFRLNRYSGFYLISSSQRKTAMVRAR